ncbi:UNVERIFIED_ORG: CHAT domain-containing protein [Zoogloea ramigera]|uniref:CHAT domain-containing protein n=1 Tax=Duganella zoogloeoides TaxID=75659 RepID=A0ABZ0Y046_9BURK|nr:CHAT domain-containing protein [Duganella zoogloeoides]WQH05226.1 CHAT domain-containing protein [Duganella zoogloeoides]
MSGPAWPGSHSLRRQQGRAALALAVLLSPAMAPASVAAAPVSAPVSAAPLRAQVEDLAGSGRYRAALAQAEPALALAERNFASGTPAAQMALLEALYAVGHLRYLAGDAQLALQHYSRALAVSQGVAPQLALRWAPILVPAFDELAKRRGAHALAVQQLAPVLAYPGMESAAAWSLRFDVRSRLGRAALRAGDAAVAQRELALAFEERVAAIGITLQTPIMVAHQRQVRGDLTTLRNVQQRMLETVGALGQTRQISRDDGRPARDYAVRHDWLEADTPAANLVRLHAAEPEWLLAFYHGAFADYARKMQQVPQEEGYVELEMEYAVFGAYLSAAGRWAPAAEAIVQALRLNALRLPAEQAYLTPDHMVAALATRRALVHLAVSHQLAADAADAAGTAGAAGVRTVVGELMQIKELSGAVRLGRAAALRQALAAGSDPVEVVLAALNRLDPNASFEAYAQYSNLDLQLQTLLVPYTAPLTLTPGARLLAQVQGALGDEVLLAYSVHQPLDFATMTWQPPRYLGQLVSAQRVTMAELGPAAAINAELADWRAALLAGAATEHAGGAAAATPVAAVAGLADAFGVEAVAAGGSDVPYRRLLQPLLGKRAAAASYVVWPDAELAQLPFEALVDDSGQYLLARGPWRYLGAVRQLLAAPSASRSGGAAVVLGAPDFDAGPAPVAPAVAAAALRPALQQLRFKALPAAAGEAAAVAAALRGAGQPVQLYSGAQASTQVLRKLHGPRYLHLATHGFFLGEAGGGSEEVLGKDGQAYLHDMQVPQFNSGLALAGVNRAPAAIGNPGLLFASQLAQLDLDGTELAVLSACESGAGMVVAGETVDSLRQSLEAAGARSAVTTLWPVSDAASADLMGHFYRGLAAGLDKGEALRQAKLALAPRWHHPYFWAPYVLSGAR